MDFSSKVYNIAEKLGTRAYRAVGSNGHLTGFARGINVKKALLKAEGIKIRGSRVADLESVTYRFWQ